MKQLLFNIGHQAVQVCAHGGDRQVSPKVTLAFYLMLPPVYGAERGIPGKHNSIDKLRRHKWKLGETKRLECVGQNYTEKDLGSKRTPEICMVLNLNGTLRCMCMG